MKEVFTKSFWKGVKKTFDQAREEPPPANNTLATPGQIDPSASSTPATPTSSVVKPSSPSVLNESGTQKL
jgi:hypothetical protein